MSDLQRLGSADAIKYIQQRCRERAEYFRQHPEEAARRDAEIDAERARMAAMTNGATNAARAPEPPQDKYSRRSMRISNADE